MSSTNLYDRIQDVRAQFRDDAQSAAPTLMRGALVADFVAIIGSLDGVMGEVDR